MVPYVFKRLLEHLLPRWDLRAAVGDGFEEEKEKEQEEGREG